MPSIGNACGLIASVTFTLIASTLVTTALTPLLVSNATAGEPESRSPAITVTAQSLVNQLGHDSFHRRRSADDQLRQRLASTAGRSEAMEALRAGLKHSSLEVRLAADRLIRQHRAESFDAEVERLLNPRVDPGSIRLAGWDRYSKTAGTDHPARTLFAKLAVTHGNALRELERDMPAELLSRVNPYQVARDDSVSWALVLMIEPPDIGTPQSITYRTAMALSNSALGPRTTGRAEDVVLQRLIDHWIGRNRMEVSARDRLRIAMRFGCHQRASELHDDVFADPEASPSSQVIAMLCATALDRPELDSVLQARLDDQRTAHVWQLIASRQTKIRTQVRDVALALLLHRRGIDPRQVGFVELQADPVMLFRDHSLGFADEVQRAAAHSLGKERLQVHTDSVK